MNRKKLFGMKFGLKGKELLFVFFFLSFFVFVPLVNADPSFIVKTPRNNQLFTVGNNKIIWDPPENIGHVSIKLYKGFTLMKAIDTYVDNSGEYIWAIDETDIYERSNEYRIRVTAIIGGINPPDIYGWSGWFSIDLHPPELFNINSIGVIVVLLILGIISLIYYNKKTHNIQNWIRRISDKIRKWKIYKKGVNNE